MFMHTKNGTVHLKDDTMYYIRFGSGSKTLIMLPGLGDGLTTVKGTALPMALMYRAYAKEYTVYMFSRRNHLPDGYSTKEMAHDLKEAMDALNIEKADFIGISISPNPSANGLSSPNQAITPPSWTAMCVACIPRRIIKETDGSFPSWVSLPSRSRTIVSSFRPTPAEPIAHQIVFLRSPLPLLSSAVQKTRHLAEMPPVHSLPLSPMQRLRCTRNGDTGCMKKQRILTRSC